MTPNRFLTLLHSKLNEWPEVEATQSCDGESIFVHLVGGPIVVLMLRPCAPPRRKASRRRRTEPMLPNGEQI